MSWSLGLNRAIADASNIIISSSVAVVIADKYPKSLNHYLVLPKNNIDSIFQLKTSHLELLKDMHLLAINIIEVTQKEFDDFKIGFHAEPSMRHLHLHVISKDFHSPCLKTKRHWNSFNTEYLIPFQILCDELTRNGHIKALEKAEVCKLLATELRCNQCNYKPISMPNLKFHLEEHWQERNAET